MDVINRKISRDLKHLGIKQESDLFYVKKDNISRLCSKTPKGNYLIIKGLKMTKIIRKHEDIVVSSAFTLSEINNFLKYYNQYFKVYFDFESNSWKINKTIFKIFFLNHKKRKYIKEFNDMIKRNFNSEVNTKSEILSFLIKTEFININDIN